MKQIVFALILALGIHGLIFGMEFNWLHNKLQSSPKTRTLTMTLTYREPQKTKPEHFIKKPDVPVKKIVLPKKKTKKKKPKPVPKPKPPKKVLKPPQIVKKIEQQEKKEPSRSEPPSKPEKTEAVEEPDSLSPEFTRDIIRKEVSTEDERDVSVPDVPVIREASPLYRINPAPKYPRIARRRGYQGMVVLEVLVHRNGRVGDLRVNASSGHKILDRAAMASVENWLFEPGMRGDQKVDMWVRVPVRFRLK